MKQPELDVLSIDAAKRDDGIIILTVGNNTRSIHKRSDCEQVIAIDSAGQIVWRRPFDFALMDCRLSLQDTLLVMGTDGRIVEIGFDGTLLHQWYCRPQHPNGLDGAGLDTLKVHHTVQEIAKGRYMSLSLAHEKLHEPIGDWTHRMVDTVVIFDRDGNIEIEFPVSEGLDRDRLGWSAEIPYWIHQGWKNTLDWSHGNCAIVAPDNSGVLVSMRHQDCVAKFGFDGDLHWILGDKTGWKGPQAERLLKINGGRPAYHQHDLSFTKDGALMLFDNGARGAVWPNPMEHVTQGQSYCLAYQIDESTMEATEVWRYGGRDVLPYSHYVSGVCEMGNGNKFIACTGIRVDAEGLPVNDPPDGEGMIYLREVTPSGEIVFEGKMSDPGSGPNSGWNGFRPQYIPRKLWEKLRAA
ncbi:aryl-sulfate sulfotransferase [Cognatishimia sp. SS12]|uniref:aryl-sulfate sulfotransferase n=1 Tax=Cognatishimia sp. SS12 TaxID=2979465 RepID=UPI00232E3712|nr:aryl-sulfate sulfotransferase [Cognatishimia sp. SS12]MDC0739562.1 aryl-sulfate sulfotransferase [Cognatishimia sp. SS12]